MEVGNASRLTGICHIEKNKTKKQNEFKLEIIEAHCLINLRDYILGRKAY
ncbi:hypothetical protein JCM19274_3970 [Algibacter lectus]|uniref:Uncharacterized protein n=1 Tax=Algibacter lectus TaxID=221126 RepID=A0A090WW60_9FLAO|nr:hypothetical protein JCM19274_3970 [Algibacter lectus]